LLLVFMLGIVLWVVILGNEGSLGGTHDQAIVDGNFSVGAHTFRYYKFSLPDGSVNVAVAGQFTSVAESRKAGGSTDRGKESDHEVDNSIEVFVLTEAAFAVWQNGYATGSLYDSGKLSKGEVEAELPAGPGVYYLVFSNKAAPKTAKSVHATVSLRYKRWLPDWFRDVKKVFGSE
jgi:hypothetical protein